MKTSTLIFFFVLCSMWHVKAVDYDQNNVQILLSIKSSCDLKNHLNWQSSVPIENWTGVTWVLDPAVNKYRVETISIPNFELTGILIIINCTRLVKLECQQNLLSGLIVIGCNSLNEILSDSNELTSMDIYNNSALETLNCNYNNLSSINVSGNTRLISLSCSKNLLATLNISNNTLLKYLYCSDNRLISLDVTKNSALEDIICNNNLLTSLDISNNSALRSITCSYNQLTTLDITKNKALIYLDCNSNYLSNLDLSQSSALHILYCTNNRLNTIDITQCTNLTDCYINSNLLKTINVPDPANLNTIVHCLYNQLPISELLKFGSNYFVYSLQYAVFEEQSYSYDITMDYSSQADGGLTTFFFRNRSKPGADGSEIIAVNNTGICRTQGNGVYFCEMVNPKLNQDNFYSHTKNITISIPGSNSSLKRKTDSEETTSVVDKSQNLINIYPNPVSDMLYVSLAADDLPATITVFSIEGKQIQQVKAINIETSLNLEDYVKGSYIVRIETSKETINRKLVKF